MTEFELVDVLSKRLTTTPELYDLKITVTRNGGEGGYLELPYGWRRGDPHGLGPVLDRWMDEHPHFPVLPIAS